ncbi:hypothetical protein B484DRAFT_478245 [Ochromonadaceae sp. CCMP2298]|nr:hypothetical protein B484DRAFT_478245 [Ochromonadaceae sp. CCMP2298]
MVLAAATVLATAVMVAWAALRIYFIIRRWKFRQSIGCAAGDVVIAFFHPYCDSGGGGERVLWVAVDALLRDPVTRWRVVIYAKRAEGGKASVLRNVRHRFGLALDGRNGDRDANGDENSDENREGSGGIDGDGGRDRGEGDEGRITLLFLDSTHHLEAERYPVATMLCQSLGSIWVAWECMSLGVPDVYCDTMGAAFAYPLVRLLCAAKVVAYVHYPIISTDMLHRVVQQRPSYNNAPGIALSAPVSLLKQIYYRLFSRLYGVVGACVDLAMVNSSWTGGHIRQLWPVAFKQAHEAERGVQGGLRGSSGGDSRARLVLVYPPCGVWGEGGDEGDEGDEGEDWVRAPLLTSARTILSVGQFRPEKDQLLQVRAIACLQAMGVRGAGKGARRGAGAGARANAYADVRLVVLGSTRNAQDEALLDSLKAEAALLGVSHCVSFMPNSSYAELQAQMRGAAVGLHTMWNEHFGISVVEMLAAGMVVVAHRSGGPRMDIITPPWEGETRGASPSPSHSKSRYRDTDANGYLAETAEEYAAAVAGALDSYEAHTPMRTRARLSARRFSDAAFSREFVGQLNALLEQ